jgi:hypothetical protein
MSTSPTLGETDSAATTTRTSPNAFWWHRPDRNPRCISALLLVGAGGFSYEEASEICKCAVGTIKSRVGRARAALAQMIEDGSMPERTGNEGDAHAEIMQGLADAASGAP